MKSKYFYWLLIMFMGFSFLSCTTGGTFPIHLKYQSSGEFPFLQQKLGPTLGIAPFHDQRPDTLYIGHHTPFRGISSHFKSEPSPLEKAITDTLSQALSGYGVKTIPISNWDGRPESLKNMETDSVLMIEIKRFWTEGVASLFKTHVKTTVQFVIRLGVKKEGKVFTRHVEVEKEMTVARSTPERIEQTLNQILTDIFDSYLSNPTKI
jgi:hypothetical protein